MSGVPHATATPFHSDFSISTFPAETKLNIFKYLNVRTAIRARGVSREWNLLLEDNALWQSYFKRDFFQDLIGRSSLTIKEIAWKERYQAHYRLYPFLLTPFPGVGARFKRLNPGNDWSAHSHGRESTLVRGLQFCSQTAESFLKQVGLFGYQDGSLMLTWELSSSEFDYQRYLTSLALVDRPNSWDLVIGFLQFKTQEDIYKMFLILKKYNQLPEDDCQLMEKLVSAGDWRKVTPLTDKDRAHMENERRYAFIP
jgi:hypothetical protein